MPEETMPPAAFDAQIRDGLQASRDNDMERAVACFCAAARCAPGSGIPYLLIGAEYAQAGMTGEAEAAYATALLLAPALDIARYQLGLLQFSAGRPAMAFITWHPLSVRPDDDPLKWFVLGFSELANDAFAAALTALREGMSRNDRNPTLNADAERMIKRVESMMREEEHAASGLCVSAELPEERHVLLGGYLRQASES